MKKSVAFGRGDRIASAGRKNNEEAKEWVKEEMGQRVRGPRGRKRMGKKRKFERESGEERVFFERNEAENVKMWRTDSEIGG